MVHHETVVEAGGRTAIRLHGELDWGARLKLEPVLEDAARSAAVSGLTIDLRGVSFVDSSGVSLLIETAEHARDSGAPLEILRPAPQVFRVFEVLGLVDVLPFTEPINA